MNNEYSIEYIRNKGIKLFLVIAIIAFGFFGIFNYVKSNSEFFNIEGFLVKSEDLGPEDGIVINFTSPMNVESIEKSISIEPKNEIIFSWAEKNNKLTIWPKKAWENGEKYLVKIENGENFLGIDFNAQYFFSIESFPKIVSISPSNGEKNIFLGIEDPIVISFDKSVDDYNIKITFSPEGQFSHEINDEKNIIKIMPKGDLKYGQRYDVYVDIKHKKNSQEDDFKRISESYFETKKLEIQEWSKDTAVRLFQAKNYTRPEIIEGKYIDINLKSQIMVLFENGKVLDSYLISSGKSGMDTPVGSFQIQNKHPRPWSKKYSLFMPFWMAITQSGEFGIHELPEWPGGYKEGVNHLGIPVSHGCVRLGVGPAERVYNWAEIGIPVITHY